MSTLHDNRLLAPLKVGILTLIIIVLFLINLAVFWLINVKLHQNVSDDLRCRSQITAETVSQFFAGKIHTVLLLDQYETIREYLIESRNSEEANTNRNYQNVVKLLRAVDSMYLNIDPIYDGKGQTSGGAVVWLANVPGNFLMTPRAIMDEHSPNQWMTQERPWFAGVAASKEGLSCTDVYTNIEFRVPCVSIVKRIEEPDSQGNNVFYGVIGLNIFMPTITEIMKKAQTGDRSQTFLLDGNEIVVFSPHDDFVERRKLSDFGQGYDDISQLIKENRTGWKLLRINGTPTYVAYAKVTLFNIDWTVVMMKSKKDAEAAISKYRNTLIFIGIFDIIFLVAPIAMLVLTERRRSAELVKAKAMAEDANRSKSTFLANISHEMRTPLNAIIGLAELAISSDEATGEIVVNLEKIYDSGTILISIINDLLDISKIEAGKFELIPVEYDMPSLINDTAALNSVRIGSKPILFTIDVDPKLPSRLVGDELRIKQILNNLLSNAFKYTQEGKVNWSITGEREEGKFFVVFKVSDTGIGIRKSDQVMLFTEYRQVNSRANRTIMGTGLGLAIVKHLVNLMDGTVSFESEYGQGSTFIARIPQKKLTDEVIGKDVAYNLGHMRYFQTKLVRHSNLTRLKLPYANVLVVDDVQANLDVARGMLKPYEMQVDCVTSGQQAIDAIRHERVRYNAVFMDHMMPGMDGIEATQRIRAIGTEYAKTVPIIALTANAIVGNEEMFLNHGFQAFLSKPINITRLDMEIRRWLRDKSQETNPYSEPMSSDSTASTHSQAEWEIEGLDKEKALFQFGGSEETYWIILESYVQNTPGLLDKIRICTEEQLEDYTVIVHGIKGTSYGICADEIGKLAEELEKAAHQGNFQFVSEHNGELIKKVEKLIDRINAVQR